jgi:hypothetical protein
VNPFSLLGLSLLGLLSLRIDHLILFHAMVRRTERWKRRTGYHVIHVVHIEANPEEKLQEMRLKTIKFLC